MQDNGQHQRGFLKNPRLPRKGETIGGGFFVFRRGEETGRIRPSQWPFEYATLPEAIAEAERLAIAYPGFDFIVVGEVHTARAEKPAASSEAEAA
ncbi:hypothetical protein [Rhizobium sp. BK602]|uniref:hypothetical protein n=1 Tax=Rhizobium sp. BK602 TaxID=2586986 RepID=UPI001608E127|nr:hypothetical protein [Rhizobium sp. BK602]MBB3608634.1 hypothetical protein [Rhizobium sp. BK602]